MDDPSTGLKQDMCVPVFPTTKHPTHRRPLVPKPILPWTDSYHHADMHLTVCIRTEWVDTSIFVQIKTLRDIVDIVHLFKDDRARMISHLRDSQVSMGVKLEGIKDSLPMRNNQCLGQFVIRSVSPKVKANIFLHVK